MAGKPIIQAEQMERLRAALRDVSEDIGDLVHSLIEDLTGDVVRDAASHVPRMTGRAKASYQARGATIVIGEGVPYVPWLEFGGRVGRKNATLRAFNPQGRYVYPAIARNAKDIEKQIDDLISQITGGFLEVEGG